MLLLLQVALLLHMTLTSGQGNNQNKINHYKRFCYVTDWAHYRDSKVAFNPEDIGAGLCTHLSLAFANLTDDGTNLKAGDPNDDPDLYTRFNRVKTHHPNLKTLLSLGGWTFGSELFSVLVSNDSKISQFATNAITFLRHRGFDGLDIDWEYPAARGSPPADKHRFTKLIRTLHVTFKAEGTRTNKPPLLLTGAFAVAPSRVHQSYEAYQLSRYFDLMNLMMYDMHGEWDKPMLAGHHAALYGTTADPHLNIDYLANYWASLNVPKHKLLIGLPFYARTMSLNDTTATDIGSPSNGPGAAGNYTHSKGTLAYYEVCTLLMNGAEKHLSNVERVPYLVDGVRWVGYDDEKSLQEKVKYVIDHGFGGVMVWALDLDDFGGICGKKYPLIHAVKDAFNGIIG